MKGTIIVFKKKVEIGRSAFNDPIHVIQEIEADDCLIAPITEPANAREQQAMQQSRDQLRVHIPKGFTGDVSNSDFVWDNRTFHLDSDSVVFMNENTPTRWNRYFRAECVLNYGGGSPSHGGGSGIVYWGTSAETSLEAADIKQLADMIIAVELNVTFDIDGEGEYLYLCSPVAFGEAQFFVNGLLNTAWTKEVVDIVETNGDVLPYNVYRSDTIQHGDGIHIKATA